MPNLPNRVYWFRVLMGIAAGALTASLIGPASVGEVSGSAGAVTSSEVVFRGITTLMFMYVVSYYLAKFVVAPQMPKEQTRKWATAGIGSFIIIFFFTWILITTLTTISF
ncbi:MAG: hypothetical protein ACE5KG_01145 [Nitrososphaerales archaeon]